MSVAGSFSLTSATAGHAGHAFSRACLLVRDWPQRGHRYGRKVKTAKTTNVRSRLITPVAVPSKVQTQDLRFFLLANTPRATPQNTATMIRVSIEVPITFPPAIRSAVAGFVPGCCQHHAAPARIVTWRCGDRQEASTIGPVGCRQALRGRHISARPRPTCYQPLSSPLRVDSRPHPSRSELILRGYPRPRRHRAFAIPKDRPRLQRRQQQEKRAGDQRLTKGQRAVNTVLTLRNKKPRRKKNMVSLKVNLIDNNK